MSASGPESRQPVPTPPQGGAPVVPGAPGHYDAFKNKYTNPALRLVAPFPTPPNGMVPPIAASENVEPGQPALDHTERVVYKSTEPVANPGGDDLEVPALGAESPAMPTTYEKWEQIQRRQLEGPDKPADNSGRPPHPDIQ